MWGLSGVRLWQCNRKLQRFSVADVRVASQAAVVTDAFPSLKERTHKIVTASKFPSHSIIASMFGGEKL